MSTISSIATSGINTAVARASVAAQNIVNESSNTQNLAANLLQLTEASVQVEANAKLIQADEKIQKTLVNIIA